MSRLIEGINHGLYMEGVKNSNLSSLCKSWNVLVPFFCI